VISAAVVIATRNRPEALSATLLSINGQTALPNEVIVVDSSDDATTENAVTEVRSRVHYPLAYERSEVRSAAVQRNLGAAKTFSEIVCFFDDDLDLEPAFVAEILTVFENDTTHSIGGITGSIRNQFYSDPHGLNRFLLALCLGRFKGSYAGGLLGPAVNFLPAASEDGIQEVQWLPSCCVAYRRKAFFEEQFPHFEGYSFAEDVHLSSRIAKRYRVVCCGKAGVYHHDLGKSTHKNWTALGKSMVVNRYDVMSNILNRNSFGYWLRLVYFELVYSSLTWLAAGRSRERLVTLKSLLEGKLAGFAEISKRRGAQNQMGAPARAK
jgi:GT2 family glycosyltransferase